MNNDIIQTESPLEFIIHYNTPKDGLSRVTG